MHPATICADNRQLGLRRSNDDILGRTLDLDKFIEENIHRLPAIVRLVGNRIAADEFGRVFIVRATVRRADVGTRPESEGYQDGPDEEQAVSDKLTFHVLMDYVNAGKIKKIRRGALYVPPSFPFFNSWKPMRQSRQRFLSQYSRRSCIKAWESPAFLTSNPARWNVSTTLLRSPGIVSRRRIARAAY